MKRKLMLVITVLMLSVVFGLFSKDQALAYWKESKDGKTQCFAIQYKYVNKTDKSKSSEHLVEEGLAQESTVVAQVYSTKKICAKVDANGKVDGKVYLSGFPDDTSHIGARDEKLGYKINSSGDTVTLSSCNTTGFACDTGNEKYVTYTEYKVSDYGNFKSFAQAVFGGAPLNYGINERADFGKNEDRDTVREEAEKLKGDEDDDDDDSGIKETCANQGGAQSLGWILCPIMELLGDASDKIYEEYVEPALRVDPKLFADSNQSVRTGWSTFRDIANVIFVILLLVVIFSQLTGVGIDNYGIKKILPKLIVVAVLINLSFIICVLAVDISNILGNSFQALFNGLSDTLPAAEDIEIADRSIINGTEVEGKLASVGILSAAVVAGGAMWTNPAIILSMLISAIGVVISIVFLFIILAVREAAVVVLIVISPVAMVCYMLPNAKRYFDRWFKGFEALLLVYPICGLLVGGGDYVSRLLLTNGFIQQGFISAFTAMIAGIVPIFFIPMLLKNSFAALGNIGAMISNVGRGTRRFATGKMRENRAYQNAQEAGRMRQTRIRSGIDSDGNAKNLSKLGIAMRGGKRNLARNRAQYLKDQEFNNRAGSLAGVGMDAAIIGQQKRAEAEDLSNYMTLVNDKTRNGEDEGALFKMFDDYMAAGNKTGAVAVARIAGRRKDTAARFADQKLTDSSRLQEGQIGPSIGSKYNAEMIQSVAKEMATGENSGNYRAAAPLAFEFASSINNTTYDGASGTLRDQAGEQVSTDYNAWAGNKNNIAGALEHHVTNAQELVGMKGSSLDEINSMISNGQIGGEDAARLQTLATQAIENRDKPGAAWDSTKAAQLATLSGQYTYDAATDTLTRIGDSGTAPSGTVAGGAAGAAAAGTGAAAAAGAAAGAASNSTNVRHGVSDSASKTSIDIPHDRKNVPVNIDNGGGGADFVSE